MNLIKDVRQAVYDNDKRNNQKNPKRTRRKKERAGEKFSASDALLLCDRS